MTNSLLEYGSAIESFTAAELTAIIADHVNASDLQAFINLISA